MCDVTCQKLGTCETNSVLNFIGKKTNSCKLKFIFHIFKFIFHIFKFIFHIFKRNKFKIQVEKSFKEKNSVVFSCRSNELWHKILPNVK